MINFGIIGLAIFGAVSLRSASAVSAPPTRIQAPAAEAYLLNDIYSGCWKRKGCVGSWFQCIDVKNCRTLVTYRQARSSSAYIDVEMFGTLSTRYPSGYVALGVSEDEWMGEDFVVACQIDTAGETGIWTYWNTEKYPQTSQLKGTTCDNSSPRPSSVLASCKVSVFTFPLLKEKLIVCSFKLRKSVRMNGKTFDMENTPFFLLTAVGFFVEPLTGIKIHKEAYRTSEKYQLWSVRKSYGNRMNLVRNHASFMILAYLVAIPNGVMVARYFKETGINYPAYSRRPFHFCHVVAASWSLGLSIYAHWCTVWDEYSWFNVPRPRTSAARMHMLIGAGATGSILLIFILHGICPCGPLRHALFSFVHAFLGTGTYCVGLYVLLTSHVMHESLIPCSTFYVIILTICWTVGWHVALTIHYRRVLAKIVEKPTIRSFLPFPIPLIDETTEAPNPCERLTYLAAHFFGTLLLSTIIISMMYGSEDPCTT